MHLSFGARVTDSTVTIRPRHSVNRVDPGEVTVQGIGPNGEIAALTTAALRRGYADRRVAHSVLISLDGPDDLTAFRLLLPHGRTAWFEVPKLAPLISGTFREDGGVIVVDYEAHHPEGSAIAVAIADISPERPVLVGDAGARGPLRIDPAGLRTGRHRLALVVTDGVHTTTLEGPLIETPER